MKRYDSYKDSGVKWLGEIPSHWEVKRLGSYFTERKVKVSDKEYEPLSVTKLGVFPQWENVAKTNDGDNRKLVKRGDFVINSRSDRKGSSGVSDRDGSVSLINIVLQPRKTIIASYTNYLLKSYKFIEEYYRNGHGIVADLWTTRFDEMKMIKVAIPSIKEQEAIANYLDAATSKIDEAIAQQQKMIDLLNERKQIIINNAVTKGLDPNVPMKDSCIDWIGNIPVHWKVCKFNNVICILTDYTANGSFGDLAKNVHYQSEGYARLVRLTDLRENLQNENGVWVDRHGYDYLSKSSLFGGELLMANVGAYSGLPCIMPKVDYPASLAPNMFLIKQDQEKITTDYLYFLLLSKSYFSWLQTIALSSAQPKLNKDNIRSLPILLPPKSEQERITNSIQQSLKPIEKAISISNNQISFLQERKQIIINDVVTGKVKVV